MKCRILYNVVIAASMAACSFLFSAGNVYAAFATISASANYTSSESTNTVAGVSTTSEFESETYSFYLSKRLTRVLNISVSGSHSIRTVNGKSDSNTSPVVSLSFSPPAVYVFTFSFNRTQTYPTDRIGLINSSMNLRFYVPTDEKFPSLNVSYNRSTVKDDQVPHLIDSISDGLRLSTSYQRRLLGEKLNLSYGLGLTSTQDNITDIKRSSTNNSLSAGWSKRYFEKKLSTSYNFSTGWSTDTYESLSAPKRFDSIIPTSAGLADRNVAPEINSVTLNGEITDNNNLSVITAMSSTGLSDIATGSDWNFGVDFGLPRNIFGLNLYILVPTSDTADFELNRPAIMTSLGWKVYRSSDNITWGPPTGIGVTPSLELVGTSGANTVYRLVFVFSPMTYRYIKLYNSGVSGRSYLIGVSEIEGRSYINLQATTSESVGRSSNSFGFSANYKHSSRFAIGYSLSLSASESEFYKGSKSTSHSLRANLRPSSVTGVSFSHSQNNSENLDAKTDSQSNSTSMSVSYRPLKTLTTSLSSSFADNKTNGKKTSSSNSLNLSASAHLYEGIDLNAALRSSSGENFGLIKSTFESTSFSWNLRLIPWRPVQLSYLASSSDSSSKSPLGSSKSSSEASSGSVSIRLSGKIYFSASFAIEPTSASVYSLSWKPLPVMGFSASYSDNDASSTTSLRTYWRLTRQISLSLSESVTEQKNTTKDRAERTSFSASFRF